jgi:outer membrane protein assembly factor BamE (lipoprotein component of BamABCDE complex)
MNRFLSALSVLVALALAGCSTPSSRIANNRAAFDLMSPDAQRLIQAGRIDIGFTPEMVTLALGEPAHRFLRKTTTGDTEVWVYHDNKPQISIGIGGVSAGSHSAVGGGVGISTGGYDPDERVRVEFSGGKVVTIDYHHG